VDVCASRSASGGEARRVLDGVELGDPDDVMHASAIFFGAGRYVDRVRRDSGCRKFASKTVVLDNRQIDTLLAISI
jgi:hypothetical protein